jgi:hypothetical protein
MCSCLKVAHSRELKSSLKNKNQDLSLREREERAQALDLRKLFVILNGQQPKGIGGGLFIVSTLKRVLGGFPPDKSGEPLRSLTISL